MIHAFPRREVSPDVITRDFVIVNEEKKLMLLTMWNDFQKDEGTILANTIITVPMIFAIRVKVTTFNNLSLSTIRLSTICINPPVQEEVPLRQWYNTHKEEIKHLLDAKAYKNATLPLPPPKHEDIKRIRDMQASIGTQRVAWISGDIALTPGQNRLWYTACTNCLRSVSAETDWIIKCPSCKQESEVELRSRIGITVTDPSGSIDCSIYGIDAEKMIEFNALQLKESEENGIAVHDEISDYLTRYRIIYFFKSYETTFQGQPQRRNNIIKSYTTSEVLNLSSTSHNPPHTPTKSLLTTPSTSKQAQPSTPQLFTPTTSLILEEIVESTEHGTPSPPKIAGSKRTLQFPETECEAAPLKLSTPSSQKNSDQLTTTTLPTSHLVPGSPKEKTKEA